MSDATASLSASSIGSVSAAAETALVSFASDLGNAAEFTDSPPSEWAFAAHEAAFDGEPIDAMCEADSDKLMPMVAMATFVIAEAEFYAGTEDALVAMTPAPFAFDAASLENEAPADVGMVMWSGDSSETGSADESVAIYARGEAGLALHDLATHGISLDWTDTIVG